MLKALALPLLIDQAGNGVRHVIEGFTQGAELVARSHPNSLSEVSPGDVKSRAVEVPYRAGDRAGEHRTGDQRGDFENQEYGGACNPDRDENWTHGTHGGKQNLVQRGRTQRESRQNRYRYGPPRGLLSQIRLDSMGFESSGSANRDIEPIGRGRQFAVVAHHSFAY